MDPVRDQLAFIVAYATFLILARNWAQSRLRQNEEAERRRRRALEWERRVGIPYDPEADVPPRD